MTTKRGYWNQQEKGSGVRDQQTATPERRPRPQPIFEPMEETGDFRAWYREKYGKDPVSGQPVREAMNA